MMRILVPAFVLLTLSGPALAAENADVAKRLTEQALTWRKSLP